VDFQVYGVRNRLSDFRAVLNGHLCTNSDGSI
jgi:hypothetical protein